MRTLKRNKWNGVIEAPRRLIWSAIFISVALGWLAVDASPETRNEDRLVFNANEEIDRFVTALEAEIFSATSVASGLATLLEISPDLLKTYYDDIVAGLLRTKHNIIKMVLISNSQISLAFPLDGSEEAIGFDLAVLGDEIGAKGLQRAIDERRTALVGPVPLNRKFGSVLVAYTPIYSSGDVSKSELLGIATTIIDVQGLFDTVGLHGLTRTYEIAIRNGRSIGSQDQVVHGEMELFEDNLIRRKIWLPDTEWEIAVLPKDRRAVATAAPRYAKFVLYVFVCGLILYSLWYTIRQSDRRRRAEVFLNEALNAIDDGFVIYDAEDRFVVCNEAYRDLYRESQDMFRPGVTFSEIVREGARRGQYAAAVGREEEWAEERLEQHLACDSESVQRLSDGRWLKVSERKTTDGCIVGFCVDITELKEARESAERAYQAKSEFISVLSHELRTPLTIILGYAKVLANLHRFKDLQALEELLNGEEFDNQKVSKLVTGLIRKTTDQALKMEKSGAHLLVLINDLLDYSKIEAGHFILTCDDTSLKFLVRSVVEDMSDFAQSKGLELRDECHDITVDADHIRLKQVLINLINNAIKFSEKGEIIVETTILNDAVEIAVIDTGCGVAPDQLEAIFDAFQQADLSDKRCAKGTGLGLAISRRIMELHGGTLTVESEYGIGSRFIASLPHRGNPSKQNRTVTARLLNQNAA